MAYSADGRRAPAWAWIPPTTIRTAGWTSLWPTSIRRFFALYKNNGDETFDDVADAKGIGMPTRWMSGWGLKFFDYDNDGNLDLFLANGHPDDLIETVQKDVTYRKVNTLNRDNKVLRNVGPELGPYFCQTASAPVGLAVSNLDNDGAIDVLISVNDSEPLLLRNTAVQKKITHLESSSWARIQKGTRMEHE